MLGHSCPQAFQHQEEDNSGMCLCVYTHTHTPLDSGWFVETLCHASAEEHSHVVVTWATTPSLLCFPLVPGWLGRHITHQPAPSSPLPSFPHASPLTEAGTFSRKEAGSGRAWFPRPEDATQLGGGEGERSISVRLWGA